MSTAKLFQHTAKSYITEKKQAETLMFDYQQLLLEALRENVRLQEKVAEQDKTIKRQVLYIKALKLKITSIVTKVTCLFDSGLSKNGFGVKVQYCDQTQDWSVMRPEYFIQELND